MSGSDESGGSVFERIGKYYEDAATRCWEVAARGHLHVGYWNDANADAEPWVGPRRMTEWLIERTGARPGQRFIDFGAGFGEPALLLAAQAGCEVDGVNASPYQTGKAIASAEAQGLADRVRFRVEDAHAVAAPDGAYDGGWFVESIFHMDRPRVLREARRLLKPGAPLLITDFTNHERTSAAFLDLQRDILLAEHAEPGAYPRLLAEAGFEVVETVDLTDAAILRGDARNRASFELHRDEMLAITDAEYLSFVREVSDLFAQNAGYLFIKARAV